MGYGSRGQGYPQEGPAMQAVLADAGRSKATLNKSLAAGASRFWTVCFVANARDTTGYRRALRLASHPKVMLL